MCSWNAVENKDYRLPWLPSLTSGCHGGRQAHICSLMLTSGLFSRAGEKPQQWSHAYFKSWPIRSRFWATCTRSLCQGLCCMSREGVLWTKRGQDFSKTSMQLLWDRSHTHNTPTGCCLTPTPRPE